MTQARMVSTGWRYALRAIFELSLRDRGQPVKIQENATAQSIPARFLGVALSELKHGGYVDSKRGSDGGYMLTRDACGLTVGEALPLCVAAIEFFEERGERKNRRRARLRHIREKVGDESFRRELEVRFVRVKKRQNWPVVLPVRGDSKKKLLCRLQLRNGNISPEEAIALAEAGEAQGAILRINLEHGLELYGTETIELGEDLSALCGNAIIIACPGSTTCPQALCDCWATADSIRGALEGMELGQLRINISGCPNNCAHSSMADIGLVGLMRKEKAESVACYRLFRDGGNGRSDKLAEQQGIMRAADAAETIKRLLGGDKIGGA